PAEAWKAHNCIPDEHYIQTLLAQSGLEEELTRRSVTYSAWDLSASKDRERRGWHPVTYKVSDATPRLIKSIKDVDNIYYETENRREWCTSNGKPAPCFLFARKFPRGAGLKLLDSPAEAWKAHNCIPDEHYIQTLLAQSGLEEELTRRSVTYSAWDLSASKDRERRGWHPITYKVSDATPRLIKSIKDVDNIYYETENRREWCTSNGKPAPCFLFARKFPRGAGLKLLDS
ncbi:hypothetical protein ACJX0J_042049, partial [Zea mays]